MKGSQPDLGKTLPGFAKCCRSLLKLDFCSTFAHNSQYVYALNEVMRSDAVGGACTAPRYCNLSLAEWKALSDTRGPVCHFSFPIFFRPSYAAFTVCHI